jgi:hypothetical protein
MKKKIKILDFKNFLILTILFLVFAKHVNFFKGIYLLSFRGYEERMIRTYGWGCDKPHGYQFIKHTVDSAPVGDKSFYIYNFHKSIREWLPPIDSLFVNLTIDKNKEKIILIDYKDQPGAHTKELKSIGVDLNNYNRISFIPGCAYFKKK